VRSLEDPDLVDRLVRDRVPLTVCPLSNLALRVVDRLEDHPLPALLAAGIPVSINSDDPAYFGGYLGDNYLAAHEALGLELRAAGRDRPVLADRLLRPRRRADPAARRTRRAPRRPSRPRR
jgi:adenosine deaminase